MPILHEESSLYPATLLEPGFAVGLDRRWMALYTRPRQEKSLARELQKLEIAFYLPLIKKTHRYGRKKVTSSAPLFGGYIFLFGDDSQRIRTLTTNRVLRVLDVDDAEGLIRDLRQLQQMIAANVPLTAESRLLPGHRVRVRRGPFAGIEGTVLQRRGVTRLLVSVNFLQRGASIEIEDSLLEPLS